MATATKDKPIDTAFASYRGLRTSPRKANLVLQMIRGRHVGDALRCLTTCRRRIAEDIKKVVQSAIANAENNHNLDIDRLYVSEATVGKGLVMKRWHARARGRGARVEKPFSNVRITLQQR